MEGFLNIRLPVWKRVFITRSIAILPALVVAFISEFDEVDTYLNILQSVQLPFALIPLIKFTSSPKIMSASFANSTRVMYLAAGLGCLLFLINAVGLIPIGGPWSLYLLVFSLGTIYVALLVLIIREPVQELMPISEEEIKEQQLEVGVVEINEVEEVEILKA
jgi:Mn2+/Fe2+ NRAMP family transporter